jgi:hypothetical protein
LTPPPQFTTARGPSTTSSAGTSRSSCNFTQSHALAAAEDLDLGSAGPVCGAPPTATVYDRSSRSPRYRGCAVRGAFPSFVLAHVRRAPTKRKPL